MEERGAAVPAVERQLLRGLGEMFGHQPDVCGEKVLSARPPHAHGVPRMMSLAHAPGPVAVPSGPGSCLWCGEGPGLTSSPAAITFPLSFHAFKTRVVIFLNLSTPTTDLSGAQAQTLKPFLCQLSPDHRHPTHQQLPERDPQHLSPQMPQTFEAGEAPLPVLPPPPARCHGLTQYTAAPATLGPRDGG